MRVWPSGVLLCVLAATPSQALTLSCGRLLDQAVDAPIPLPLILGRTVLSFPDGAASLDLLANHVASIPIGVMPSAYVGLGDDVAACIAYGCDGFVYAVSDGYGALSRTFRIDGSAVLKVWRHDPNGAPDDPIYYRFGGAVVTSSEQVVANITLPSAYIYVAWADIDERTALDRVDGDLSWWLGGDDRSVSIPRYTFFEQPSIYAWIPRELAYYCPS